MSSKSIAVRAENVSKRYVLQRSKAGDLRELISSVGRRHEATDASAAFYALRDVGFTIESGETVGVVGHNGSGKSTLLKMLTGIIKPDTGQVQTVGRIGALIEVGAGFHPDMTGRENIFLNGSIMGLTRQELSRRFDEIVAFSGLERFIDTPVKRYSSGMYMRLGFAIATHIEPAILLIDEVLAVGDTQFQNKCLGFLNRFAADGGTVVFVSHSMAQVAQLCQRCLWLDRGQLVHDGATQDAIDKYMAVVAEREEEEFKRTQPEEWAAREAERAAQKAAEEEAARAAREAEQERQRLAQQEEEERLAAELSKSYRQPTRSQLLKARLLVEGRSTTELVAGQAVEVEIDYRLRAHHPSPAFCLDIFRSDGLYMFTTSNYDHELVWNNLPLEGTVRFTVPFLSLNQGEYRVRLSLFTDWKPGDWESVLEDVVESALVFTVTAGRFAHGCAFLPVHWESVRPARKEEVHE